ncbi:MAG: hypothetical protein GFH27_549323n68 [Chloroflexi bacterium AL-W]|nr:hypothetical protein [Chloroflexi bacterium AL-N1]NOK70219.1 hypothetical protein [Chloroflexi bacterium AL-N10]NOK77756.1 hypothetical protein [Chloroflexi bacterium AL-N5]NOK84765.1 hypothetical protein [Chloroflexi bacterium AL-W]NOK92372.1 hypothetical protein [Chloroflexi bacterium AL-N15]
MYLYIAMLVVVVAEVSVILGGVNTVACILRWYRS